MVQQTWGRRRAFKMAIIVLLALVVGWLTFHYFVVNQSLQPQVTFLVTKPATPQLAWPNYGQAAVAIEGKGVVATHGSTKPQPTASTAKTIAMLAVQQKRPLKVGEQGPIITLTQADVDRYNTYISEDGSNTRVVAGETITQYQAMESVLLASSNNMADSLAIWAFGSLDAYHAYAKQLLAKLGATQTTVAVDASGFHPQTVSTAHDLALIGLAALKDPVVASIVSRQQATVPEAGTIYNTNHLLGSEGVVGVKTGETVQAGGVFILGARQLLAHKSTHITVTVMGADSGAEAQQASAKLYQSVLASHTVVTEVKKGQVVGQYRPSWSEKTYQIIASREVKGETLLGQVSQPTITIKPAKAGSRAGSQVGTLAIDGASTPLLLQQTITPPTWLERIGL